MKTISFAPGGDLILVSAVLWGPLGGIQATLALDTAASDTLVSPSLLDSIGYSARDAVGLSTVSSVVGREVGYRLQVKCFESLGFAFEDFLLNAHEFHEGSGIDGLLGLSFLHQFDYSIFSLKGTIHITAAEP